MSYVILIPRPCFSSLFLFLLVHVIRSLQLRAFLRQHIPAPVVVAQLLPVVIIGLPVVVVVVVVVRVCVRVGLVVAWVLVGRGLRLWTLAIGIGGQGHPFLHGVDDFVDVSGDGDEFAPHVDGESDALLGGQHVVLLHEVLPHIHEYRPLVLLHLHLLLKPQVKCH